MKWFQINSRTWVNRDQVIAVRIHVKDDGICIVWYDMLDGGDEFSSSHANESDALSEVLRFLDESPPTTQPEDHGQ